MSGDGLGRPAMASAIGLESLIRLRWAAGLAEVGAIAVAGFALGVHLPVPPLLALAAMTLATNLLLATSARGGRASSPAALGGLVAFDVLLLTAMLALSGGPSNPFSVFYLVYVALASTLLGARWAWGTVVLSVGCFSLLFFLPGSLAAGGRGIAGHVHDAPGFAEHLWGMLAAFAVAASLVAYFVTRLTRALRARELELAAAQERAARSERIASVMVLAAGAAHELSTPLGTIALAARELEREAARRADGASLVDDARLIRSEVARCRAILDQLSVRSGELGGEAPLPVAFEEIVREVQGALAGDAARLRVSAEPALSGLVVPRNALVQVLGNLVRNALDASPEGAPVELAAGRRAGLLRVEVRDQGRGMSPEQLARATEPFFTTKERGNLGLGLFLVERFAHQLGGRLVLESRPDAGTRAILEIPA